MEVKIDRGVEMTGSAGRAAKYPWAKMEVGDSFLSSVKHVANIYQAKMLAQNKHKMKFSCRTTPEGVRVWRIA